MSTTRTEKPAGNRPPYRVVCYVGQTDRKFWEQNGVGFAHKKIDGAIVFTPPFDIKSGTPVMIAPTDDEGNADTGNTAAAADGDMPF